MKFVSAAVASLATAFVGSIALAAPAAADLTTNPTTNDAVGYCNVNHLANFNEDNHGIGWARSETKGAIAAANREIRTEGSALNIMCTTTQGQFAPVSNNSN